MITLRGKCRIVLLCGLLGIPLPCIAQSPRGNGELADEPLVDVARIDPTIVIDLRYASVRNITGHPIYPPGTPCMIRRGVAEQLKKAQAYLRAHGFKLKIWDAYRPPGAQQILWDLVQNPEVVAPPSKGGSRHSWGVAVDVTLVDLDGGDVPMPTDFDDFTAAAKSEYTGRDPEVAMDLRVLKNAMEIAGFEGIRDEWWHYSSKNWQSYKAITIPDAMAGGQPASTPAPANTSTPAIQTGTNPVSNGETAPPR